MRALLIIIIALAFGQPPSLWGQESDRAPAFSVIINAQNHLTSVDRAFLSDVFFKRVTRWPNNNAINPVDLKADSPVRREFSKAILSRSVSGIKSYWQQLIFSGRNVPPPEMGNEAEVIQYVVKNPGAIGYVSSAAGISGVKTVKVR